MQTVERPGTQNGTVNAGPPVPQPDLNIVARATALESTIRAGSAEAETNRRIPDSVIDALQEAGLLHIAIPKRWGGQGANFTTFIEAVAEISRADGATGWASALLNVCTWFATLFSERAQQEVFGSKLSRVCGIFTPPEKTEHVDGGVRVTGEWAYASGSFHADWATLGVLLGTHEDGSPHMGLALIPLTDLTIKDTWHVAGMRGTGSNTLVANDVFVPSYRIQSFDDLATDSYAREWAEETNYNASFVPVAEIVLVAAQLGLARAAVDITIQKGAKKSVAYTVFQEARNSPAHQIQLAEAACDADAGRLLALRACADIDTAAAANQRLDARTRARIRMDTGRAAKSSREAINRLLSVNGASSFANVNPLQRIWRDSELASRHAFVMPEMASLIYGRVLFGIQDIVQLY
jgi:alkylation response protein AidB-like acyl-CoA dehydrogenase